MTLDHLQTSKNCWLLYVILPTPIAAAKQVADVGRKITLLLKWVIVRVYAVYAVFFGMHLQTEYTELS